MEQITLRKAHQLFEEARGFASGRVMYMREDSEIRVIARQIFGQEQVTHLTLVCNEIFYVLACEFKDVPR